MAKLTKQERLQKAEEQEAKHQREVDLLVAAYGDVRAGQIVAKRDAAKKSKEWTRSITKAANARAKANEQRRSAKKGKKTK